MMCAQALHQSWVSYVCIKSICYAFLLVLALFPFTKYSKLSPQTCGNFSGFSSSIQKFSWALLFVCMHEILVSEGSLVETSLVSSEFGSFVGKQFLLWVCCGGIFLTWFSRIEAMGRLNIQCWCRINMIFSFCSSQVIGHTQFPRRWQKVGASKLTMICVIIANYSELWIVKRWDGRRVG